MIHWEVVSLNAAAIEGGFFARADSEDLVDTDRRPSSGGRPHERRIAQKPQHGRDTLNAEAGGMPEDA